MRRTTIVHLRGGGPRGHRRGHDLLRGRAARLPAGRLGAPGHRRRTRSRASRRCSREWTRTAAGPSRARRSTSRCGRPARPCGTCSDATRGRSRSSRRCGSARPLRSTALLRRLELYPTLRFKLDPTSDWDEQLVAQLAETGAVDSVDLKGSTRGRSSTNRPTRGCTAWWWKAFPTRGSKTRR